MRTPKYIDRYLSGNQKSLQTLRTKLTIICIISLLLITSILKSQVLYTLSGNISNARTGEDLIGAAISLKDQTTGTITNSYGFYSLSIPEGDYVVQFSYLGYERMEKEINLGENQVIDIELEPRLLELDEVNVSSEREDKNITSVQLGMERLDLEKIKSIPVFFGENDILKTLQLLPGVSYSAEGGTGFNVRGGSMGQNLILLDEAPVYSSAHLLGFFSVFNSEAINDVTLFKGGIPAKYGGRASSVLDITMNNGNSKKFSSNGGIGLVSSRLTLEGPIVKDRISYIISGRRTYADLVAKLFAPGDLFDDDTQFYFYDLNAKLNYRLNDNNRIFISGYFGKDVLELGDNVGTSWGNTTGTFRWNHLFSESLFSNTSLIYSKYDYGFLFGQGGIRLRSGIEDITFKEDATWFLNPENTLKAGFEFTYHTLLPIELRNDDFINFEPVRSDKRGLETAFYLQNKQKISSRFSTNYGFRFSIFNQFGPGWFYEYNEQNEIVNSEYFEKSEPAYPYFALEPRIALNYRFTGKSSVKLSYNRMAQYLHLLSNTTAGLPTDVWLPSSNNLKPLYVNYFSGGFFRNFRNNGIETSIEAYYKDIQNAVDYEDGADVIFDEHVEAQILSGKGRSYGCEIYAKKNYGRFTGWISYTLSRTENRIEGVNNGSWYPVMYDKTHDLSIIGIFQLTKRLSLSGVWVYNTGNAVTFPSGKYYIDNNPVPYYTERNGYRMPAYHRLDISLNLKGKERKKFQSGWDFSIYNVYNRYNAYMITFRESETTTPGATEAVKLSLFGIVPSVSWNFKF